MSTMQSIPLDSGVLAFAGALDVARTASGFIPRRLPAWTNLRSLIWRWRRSCSCRQGSAWP